MMSDADQRERARRSSAGKKPGPMLAGVPSARRAGASTAKSPAATEQQDARRPGPCRSTARPRRARDRASRRLPVRDGDALRCPLRSETIRSRSRRRQFSAAEIMRESAPGRRVARPTLPGHGPTSACRPEDQRGIRDVSSHDPCVLCLPLGACWPPRRRGGQMADGQADDHRRALAGRHRRRPRRPRPRRRPHEEMGQPGRGREPGRRHRQHRARTSSRRPRPTATPSSSRRRGRRPTTC